MLLVGVSGAYFPSKKRANPGARQIFDGARRPRPTTILYHARQTVVNCFFLLFCN